MDPATLKMALQILQVLARSRMIRKIIAGLVFAGILTGGATAFGALMVTNQLSASLGAQQHVCLGTTNETADVIDVVDDKATGDTAVWQALRTAGFDAAHAAGVMGNMQVESGFDPHVVQGGGRSTRPADAGGAGYGLVQWTPGRKLSDYIGSAIPTVSNEVATLKAQLAGRGPHPEKAAGDAFWATRDVTAAATAFHLQYERSASTDSTQRVRNATAIYTRMQGTPLSSSPAAPNAPPADLVCPAAAASTADEVGGDQTGTVTGLTGRTTMDGISVSAIAAAQIRVAEQESGIDFRIVQGDLGGFHVAASGTSHNYSGVVDVVPATVASEKAMRQAGFAAWARNIPGRASVGSGAHVHAASLLDPGTREAPQITGSWPRHQNGLGTGPDPVPHYAWYPDLVRRLTLQGAGA